MARHRQRDGGKERYWRAMIGQWRRSGQSVRDFCAERGLAEPSFYAWRRTLAERKQPVGRAAHRDSERGNGQPAFVPVCVAPAATAKSFEVVLTQGRVVRVPSDFDATTLRQLLAVLEEEPSC